MAASRFTPAPSEVGERVDVVLARRWSAPRAAVKAALDAGAVTVSGAVARSSHRLGPDDVVEGLIDGGPAGGPAPEHLPVVVRYSDDRVFVVSKPPGLVTHPAPGHGEGTLVNALLGLGEPLAARGSVRPGIVHRLDKDTSGLLLVAKDDAAHAALTRALRDRRVERRYLALVRGSMPSPAGTIDAPIGRQPSRPTIRAVTRAGKAAVTHYRVLGEREGVSLLDVALDTGRTHQIRVHLSHLGHPVVGDATYGGAGAVAAALGLGRPFLHAVRLAWPHPGDGRRIEVTDELPADLTEALARAGLPWPLADPEVPPRAPGPAR